MDPTRIELVREQLHREFAVAAGITMNDYSNELKELVDFERSDAARDRLYKDLVPLCGDNNGHWCTDGTDGLNPLPNSGFCQIHRAWAEATKELVGLVEKAEARRK